MIDTIDITTSQRKTILEMLKRYLPDTAVWAYGSRVKWTSHPESDLDMVVFASPDQKNQVSDLKEALEESDLPFRVDVFEWDEVPEGFRKNIEAEHVVLQEEERRVVGSEWEKVCFGDLYKEPSRNGLTKPKKVRGQGIKFINMGEIFSHDRLFNAPADRAPLNDREISSSLLEQRDLLFARQSLVLSGAGKCSIFINDKEPVSFESHLIRVRLDTSKVAPEYYYYYFRSPYGRAAIYSIVEQGAGVSGIRGSDLANLVVTRPPLPDQRAIAHILGSLDDKIELNRQMNQTLEKMAQAIFKSWFIDFDPVKRNRGLRRVNCENSKETFHENSPFTIHHSKFDPLFPDSFEDSELGKIPKGWTCGKLETFIEVNPKRRIKKGTPATYLDMKNMPTTGMMPSDWWSREFTSGMRFKNGDTLFARITPCLENGKTSYVNFLIDEEIGWGSTEYIVLHSKPPLSDEFSYFLARNKEFRSHAIANMTGSSGRQRVPAIAIQNFLIARATDSVCKEFSKHVTPIVERIKELDEEGKILKKLRDTLLPKLISGELPIPDAKTLLEGVE